MMRIHPVLMYSTSVLKCTTFLFILLFINMQRLCICDDNLHLDTRLDAGGGDLRTIFHSIATQTISDVMKRGDETIIHYPQKEQHKRVDMNPYIFPFSSC